MGSVKLLKASAGSGKTYRLAYEYVRTVIGDPWQYRHILAVTFTNKATEEMKRRIVAEINELAHGHETKYLAALVGELGLTPEEIRERAHTARTRILHDYSRFSVLTIDKFFQRLIRSFIKELGIDLNFNLELQTGTLLSAAADDLMDEISLNESLKKWVAGFVEERIGENRRWEIKSELIRLGHHIFSEEYRRSGAMRVSREELERIVSAASADASEITDGLRSTARQALDIIANNGLAISDFPYGKSGFANFFAKYAEGDIAEPGSRVMDALGSDEKWYAKNSAKRAEIEAVRPALRPLLQELAGGYEKHHRFLNSVGLLRANYRNFALLSDLLQKTEEICAAENILPISETNNILNKLIVGNDTPFIFEKAGNHFNRFMIDEFQDTSAMQWENFIPLLQNAAAQSEASPILLVGDVKQSIYRWRGGDWRILAGGIGREFADTETLDLNTNYRSFGNIVAFNNEITESCVVADNDRLNYELDAALESGLIDTDLHSQLSDTLWGAYRNHAQQSVKGAGKGYVNITVYEKKEEDRAAIPPIISRIEELQSRGYRPGDIAVLVRTGAEGVRIADMLLAHKQANPSSPYSYDVVTQEALLINSSPAVGFALACFRLAVSHRSALQQAVYNKFSGRPLNAAIPVDERDFLSRLRLMPPEEAFEAVVMRFGLNARRNDVAYLQAFHEQLLTFARNSVSDIQLFLDWWDENGGGVSVNIPKSDSAITISTIHKSKGLEYKAVIIPYCNWELNPRSNTTIVWADGSRIAEGLGAIPVGFSDRMRNSLISRDYYRELVMAHVDNMNIFYVAVTRAEEELHIMMPADPKPRNDRINALILNALIAGGGTVRIGRLEGKTTQDEGNTAYEFGEKMHADYTPPKEQKLYSTFGSYAVAERLALRMDSARYFPDGEGAPVLAPRDYGILMHRAFEAAANGEDIGRAVAQMTASGLLAPNEAQALGETINKALAQPLVRSWFDGSWEVVRNENDIILPGAGRTRRPDRVMTRNDRAVIVDYKFGLMRPEDNVRQIREYAGLLRRMGYRGVSGYIWYVTLGDIETAVRDES